MGTCTNCTQTHTQEQGHNHAYTSQLLGFSLLWRDKTCPARTELIELESVLIIIIIITALADHMLMAGSAGTHLRLSMD